MGIKQILTAWLLDQKMDQWWSRGTRDAMAGALAEIERLEREVADQKGKQEHLGKLLEAADRTIARHERERAELSRMPDGARATLCVECLHTFGSHAANCSRRFARGLGP